MARSSGLNVEKRQTSARLSSASHLLLAAIVGKTRLKIRERIIRRFRTETDFHVLLIFLQVGGEGLSLQVADRVYLMDPWWNPAMEQQAHQRAHRSLDGDQEHFIFLVYNFLGIFICGKP